MPSNKGMKLTKLVAAPVWQAEVPPRAFRRFAAARTASQLIWHAPCQYPRRAVGSLRSLR